MNNINNDIALSELDDTEEDIYQVYKEFGNNVDTEKWKAASNIVLINILQRIEEKLDLFLTNKL